MTESIDFELGINTFLETSPDPVTGKRISHSERIRNGIEEIVVADQVGLDVFGIGEHQRFDFASEAPAVILAAAAALTKRIRLTSAVTVLSSDDPVRVYQSFSTLDSISNGLAPLVELYKQAAASAGHDVSKLKIATHSHGFVGETTELAVELHRPYTVVQMNELGRVLGWPPYSAASYDDARKMNGALYVGDPEYVAEKILLVRKKLGTNRFFLHLNIGTLPHREVLRAIEMFGTRVAPIVRKEIAKENKQTTV